MVSFKKCENVGEYLNNLNCCLDNFSSLKEELKLGYRDWKLNDDKNSYDSVIVKKQVNVDNLISKLRLKLNEDYTANKNKLEEMNLELNNAKSSLERWIKKYNKEKNSDLASGPLNKDTSKELIQEYLYLGFLTVGVIFSSSFLYKTFKL